MAEEQALVQLMDTLDGLELTKSEYEWLEQRFAAMTEKEQLLFRGAMKLEKPETASEAIDICCWTWPCGIIPTLSVWEKCVQRRHTQRRKRPAPVTVY